MSDQLAILTHASPAESSPERTGASARLRWFELALLPSIAFGPAMFNSVHVLATGQPGTSYAPGYRWSLSLFYEVTALLLLGYILARRKERFTDLGLRWSLRDLTTGVGLAIGSYCTYYVGYIVVHAIHHAIFGASHSGVTSQAMFGHSSIWAIPFFLVNPFFEELIVRAYLMSEIRALTGSVMLSAAVSVALQTAYHLYYGWEGALALGFQFLVFAIYYANTRKATPIIVAHGAFDLLGLAQLW